MHQLPSEEDSLRHRENVEKGNKNHLNLYFRMGKLASCLAGGITSSSGWPDDLFFSV